MLRQINGVPKEKAQISGTKPGHKAVGPSLLPFSSDSTCHLPTKQIVTDKR